MMKVEVDPDVIPEGYEAVRFGRPKQGDLYINSLGWPDTWEMIPPSILPQLILKKKEPEYRPYEKEELIQLLGCAIKHKTEDYAQLVVSVRHRENEVVLGTGNALETYYLFDNYTFLDGSPIGKKDD